MLPPLNVYDQQPRYFEIFNRGDTPFQFHLETDSPWLQLTQSGGTIQQEQRIWVNVDWATIPRDATKGTVTVSDPDGRRRIIINVPILNPASPQRDALDGFVETDGWVSIEAEHFTGKSEGESIHWVRLPDFGRTLSAMTTFPVNAAAQRITAGSPHLDYKMYLFHTGEVSVDAYLAPTQKFQPGEGLRYGISFDEEVPQVINLHSDYSQAEWERSVRDAVRVISSRHKLANPGYHILKFWALDPGIVLEKLVVNTGKTRPSYLGPPESFRNRL